MRFLIKTIVFFIVILGILGVSYAVLSPVLDGLGVELDAIFEQFTDKEKNETTKSDETTNSPSETTIPECKHVYDEDWAYHSETQHKKICKECGEKTLFSPHEFNVESICIVCGYIKPDSDNSEAHECDFTVFVKKELGFHKLKCSNSSCEQFKTIPHDYGDWKTVTEATCTEKGKESRTCSYSECQHVDYRDIPILSHVMDNGVILSSPTCEDSGKKVYSCLNCDYKEYAIIDAVGHTYSEPSVTYEADGSDCIEVTYVYCINECGYESRVTTVMEHDGDSYECISCEPYVNGGFEYILSYFCDRCGETISTSTEYGFSCWGLSSCDHDTSSGGSSDGSVSCEHADVIDTGDTLYCKTVYWSECSYCGVILDTSVYYDYSWCGDGDGDNCCDGCGKTLSTSSGGDTCTNSHVGGGTNYNYIGCTPYGDDLYEYTLEYYCDCGATWTETEYAGSCIGLPSCNH